ncbi:MAG: hypothetical protein LUD29_05315 [Clostridia bacterium]|nr:hypothetical protein [Clostridia bacterium]
MKKTVSSFLKAVAAAVIVLATVLGCCSFLAGCKSKNKKNVKTAELYGMDIYYLSSGTIDFDSISLYVTYDDGTSETMTRKEYDIKDKNAADGTEFILNTDGLYDAVQGALRTGSDIQKGNYDISFSIPDYRYSKDFETVTVGDDPVSDLLVVYYDEPEFLSTYEYRAGEAEDRPNDEDTYYIVPENYTVGDDNAFIFKPELYVYNSDTKAYGTFYGYEPEISVSFASEGTNLDIDECVSTDGFDINFTEEAIGGEFEIIVAPPEGFEPLYGSDELSNFSMRVTVADGWNVYSAKDLGMMNIVSNTFNREDFWITNETGERSDYNQQLWTSFWDEEKEDMTEKNTDEIWDEFLTENGYETRPVNGIYLHGDISITEKDIPEDFVVTRSEARHYGCDYDEMIDSVRDGVKLYEKYMEDDFTFDGNLFTVDCSSLKWAMTYIDSNGNFDHYTEQKTDVYRGGRLSVFAVQGVTDMETEERPTATFENLGGRGNAIDMNDTEGKEGGSFCFIESLSSETIIDNCHAKNFLYGFKGMDSDDSYVNLKITDTKVYDNYFSSMRIVRSARNEVYHSEFKRFSGPGVFQISEAEERAKKYSGYYETGLFVSEDSTLESPISGSEAWFVSSNATSIASYITMADSLIQACSNDTKTIINEDGKMNLMVFLQDTDDFGWYQGKMNSRYQREGSVPFILNEETEVEDLTETSTDEDVALRNAAAMNYFVDGVADGSITPIPATFSTNQGTLVAIDNLYQGFYDPAALRENEGEALGEEYELSFDEGDNEIYVYYRMDGAMKGTYLSLIVSLLDIT